MRPQPPSPRSSKPPRIYSVAEIARHIKSLLEKELGTVCVEGEVSGLTRATSGHQYFNLKDDKAVIKAVWFKGSQRGAPLNLDDGMQVKVYGDISTYSQRSEYQLVVRRIEPAGLGALQQAYEEMKKRLTEEGLFDEAHKKPLPFLPKHIGIITSPSGAVIRDMTSVLTRRFPHLRITLAGVPVQGPLAAPAIVKALAYFNDAFPVDLLIVGRGGGSLEDLWAFNEEPVVRAVFASNIPVISAVGHEPDFTLCDYASDLRAATPSAAAEYAVPELEKLVQQLASQQRHLVNAVEHYRQKLITRFARASGSYVFKEPGHAVQRHRQALALLDMQLNNRTRSTLEQRHNQINRLSQGIQHHSQRLVQQGQQHADNLHLRMTHEAAALLQQHQARIKHLASQLRALSHQSVLERGYSITRTAQGDVLRSSTAVKSGDTLRTELASGTIDSIVSSTENEDSTP